MISENKKKVDTYLDKISDDYLNEVLNFLKFLELNQTQSIQDKTSMLLSEDSLAKEWLTHEEEAAWKDL
ncbi:MAG: hypothetical protein ABJA79_05960 [Parafilimonas sp.]